MRNGEAEQANVEVLQGLNTRTFQRFTRCGKDWIHHLSAVLWLLMTTPNRATGETPFALVYGAEAVLPTELKHGPPRVSAYNEKSQREVRIDNINFLEEVRCQAKDILVLFDIKDEKREVPKNHVKTDEAPHVQQP